MKPTNTSIFIVPTLGINREGLKNNGFLNGYIKDGRKDVQYENAAYLLFRPVNLDKFKDFLDYEYERTQSIIDDYDYEGGFIILVYQLNPKFRKDFDLVRKGQYSKTSDSFQGLFPETYKVLEDKKYVDKMSVQHMVFTKDTSLKELWEEKLGVRFDNKMEFWRGWDEEQEVLQLDKVKELV